MAINTGKLSFEITAKPFLRYDVEITMKNTNETIIFHEKVDEVWFEKGLYNIRKGVEFWQYPLQNVQCIHITDLDAGCELLGKINKMETLGLRRK